MSKNITKLLHNQGDNFIFPFFWLHGETEEVLRKYMKIINESNIGAVCVESRPHPDYCGPKLWEDMDVILDEARKRNMKVWILDDSHFPTGNANGAIKSKPDEFCRQSICCRVYDLEGQTNLHIESNELQHPNPFVKSMVENFVLNEPFREFHDDRLLSLRAVYFDENTNSDGFKNSSKSIDLIPLIKNNTLDWQVPSEKSGKWKVYALHLTRNMGYRRNYINMLNQTSCKVLIDTVYEPHWEHYKDDFGKTISGFFSDEPEFGNGHLYEMDDEFGKDYDYPWSNEVEEEIKKRLNNNISLLSLLWENGANKDLTAQVRYTYMDVITKIVEKDFSYQIGNWCRTHNVKYIGHIIEDNNHHSKTGCSLGHYFRSLAGQDMAGIDDIGGQVLPQEEHSSYNNGVFNRRDGEFYHFLLGKLASSAAAIEPLKKGNSMCEIFGNYGWSEGLRLEKYLTDHFLVRGINHFVPHAFTPKEFPDPDCPPHFYANGHNPEYRHFGYLMSYMNRVSQLISDGEHIAPVALLYHGEGQWTGKHMTDDMIGWILSENQIEYDIVPQDVFASPSQFNMSANDGFLIINTQRYSTLIVPSTSYVTKEFASFVPELKKAGVSVIFIDEYPCGFCNFGENDSSLLLSQVQNNSSLIKKDDLLGALKKMPNVIDATFSPSNVYLRFIHYIHNEDGTSIYMIVNEGKEIYNGTVTFSFLQDNEAYSSRYIYDAWNNVVIDCHFEGNSLNVSIEPMKSLIVVFDKVSNAFDSVRKNPAYFQINTINKSSDVVTVNKNWKRSICKSIDYPHFEKNKIINLPDSLEKEEPEFSGFIRYENTFQIPSNLPDSKHVILNITDASEGVEVFINDASLGIQVVPNFIFDISEKIVKGENKIRIEVATTLERETFKLPEKFGRKKTEPTVPSGINGEVKIVQI